jgi:hypothetical protein
MPGCHKEIASKHGVFCLEHSRAAKDVGKKAVTSVGVLTLAAAALLSPKGKS